MLKHINLQLFAEGDTNPDEKKETNLDNKPEAKKEEGFSIRRAFGLKDKEPEKKETTKEPDKKPDEKPEEKKPDEKKPDEAKKPDATDDKDKQEPEFYEIPYMKDKDGKQQTVKIPFAERDTFLQKGYNYDKVKERADIANATLQRIARSEGFDTVDKYLAELDNREKAKLAEKIEEAAGDPDKIDEIVQNHPVVRQTKEERQKLDYLNRKADLSKDEFFKKLEPELDDLMAKNPTADPNLVYSVLVGNYVRSDAYKQELVKEREAAEKTAKEKDAAKEKKILADIHDKERRAAPIGGDSGEGKDTVTPSAFTSKIAGVFGVSPQKVAQRAHEKMKRS